MEELERDADVAVKLEACIADNDDPARIQTILENTISPESQDAVSAILEQVSRLSVAEKLLLYLRLPSARPETSPQVDRCSRAEMQRSVAWVRTHLAPQPALSLPKQHVYREYIAHAARQGMKPVSSADFGKAVKAAFPTVRPRRLGVRGQSRYCYAGIGKATTLATPTLPPGDLGYDSKRLCKRPSIDGQEFVDFSTVAPPSTAPNSRPASAASRPASVASRSASVDANHKATNRKLTRQASANPKPRPVARRTQPSQSFVPIGPKDAQRGMEGSAVTSLLTAGAGSPDMDAELLHYFATSGSETAAPPPADDKLWRLRRVLERSLDPPTFTLPPQGPTPTSLDFGLTWGSAYGGRGHVTAPPSPVPTPLSGRGYLTAPPSPVPTPLSGRGYLTAPPSPVPLPSGGRGYATAPPSPGAWPMGAWPSWRSQSVPPEPAPTPVPVAFRDFAPPMTTAQDGFFGSWDPNAGFSGEQPISDIGQQFNVVGELSDLNTPSLSIGNQGLHMNGQTLDIDNQVLDINGQSIDMENSPLFGEFKQSLAMDPQEFGDVGEGSLGVGDIGEGQLLGSRQQMAMDVISYDLAPSQEMQAGHIIRGRTGQLSHLRTD